MPKKRKALTKKRASRGPKPELFKIHGNWEKAVTKSFQKKKPPGGWPK